MEIIVLPATGKQNRIVGEGVSCGLIPAATGEGLIYAVIVQLGPEQLFERFQPAEVFKELQNRLFTFQAVYLSTSQTDLSGLDSHNCSYLTSRETTLQPDKSAVKGITRRFSNFRWSMMVILVKY